jgi:uncharacterized zinc-type alcohol dehydrogenase-like protein
MSPSTILGFAARAVGQSLEPVTLEAPELGDHDVRVSVTHCGLCYTDIHAIDDRLGVFSFPLVPGHEIVGYVSTVGDAVSGLKEGDRVGIGWQGRSCMQCEWCLKGEEHLCQDIVRCGTWTPNGGLASAVAVDSRFAYPLPAAMPSEVAAVLMCAGIAVYPPLRTYAVGLSPQVGVIGVGGLGHLAIQFARALGCEVTAISSSPGKEEEARAFGAGHFIVAADEAAMRQVEYRFDLLLCTAHGGIDWETLLMALKKNGRLVLVAFPRLALDSIDLVAHQLSITGSFMANRATMREMLAFAHGHSIAPRVELMPMSQVNGAIQRLRENKARYRIVLVNDPDDAGTATERPA